MNSIKLIYRNIIYYKRYYVLLLLAALLANAIITGSLIVGDSITQTLVKRVDERLGKAQYLISSGTGFLDKNIVGDNNNIATALYVNGFASKDGALTPVNIWGIDNNFNQICKKEVPKIGANQVVINKKIADKLNLNIGDFMVVRLQSLSMVPSGSLFISDNYTTSLRLEIIDIANTNQLGNISIKNEQTIPLNLFIDSDFLNQTLNLNNKCNMLFSAQPMNDIFSTWQPSHSGILLNDSIVTSEKLFIENHIVSRLSSFTNQHVFAYFVNEISSPKTNKGLNYSFVTALDYYNGKMLTDNEIIISNYTARELGIKKGDSISLSYFIAAELRNLSILEDKFIVSDIYPIDKWKNDKLLTADFPGLTEVDNCSNWDSALPIDMEKITDNDEKYWDDYRSTPKAIISYAKCKAMWSSSYGDATALIMNDKITKSDINKILQPADFGIIETNLKSNGINAAVNGIDFKSLFLSLAFFIIVAALFLATLPLSKMLFDRRNEIELYRSLGWKKWRLIIMLLQELKVVLFVGVMLGLGFAIIYNKIVLSALSGIWSDAVQTESIAMFILPASLIIGSLSSFIITSFVGFFTIKKIISNPKIKALEVKKASSIYVVLSGIALLLGIVSAVIYGLTSPMLFVINGVLFFVFAMMMYDFIVKRIYSTHDNISRKSIIIKNIYRNRKSANMSILTLSIGIFIVFSVGFYSKDFSDSSGFVGKTGNFDLWCDLQVPLHFDLNTRDGAERLGLNNLNDSTHFSQLYKLQLDEANCLNVNKVEQASVLGIDANDFSEHLAFASTLNEKDVWTDFSKKQGRYYPAIVDETVMMWSLGKGLGDTLVYQNSKGEEIVFQLVGALNNTVFQGSILIDKSLFLDFWKEDSGSKIILARTNNVDELQKKLSIALRDYGALITTTVERLQAFYSVTESYLIIFMMLGGFGLIVGLFGMQIVLYKNIASRKHEIEQMKSLGFNSQSIYKILFGETILIPIFAVVSGSIASLITVVGSLNLLTIWHVSTYLLVVALLLLISYLLTQKICKDAAK